MQNIFYHICYIYNQTMKQDKIKQMVVQQNRKVFDSIYDFISFPKDIWQFVDTPHFQRLRNIKQLGCLSWVFPGAVHSRFQHGLGTGHLARKYITTLIEKHKVKSINEEVYNHYWCEDFQNKQINFRNNRETAIFTVTLAGILHDVGHGPYSHLFDSKVVKKINNDTKKWEHQIASICLIDGIYKQIISRKSDQKQKKWLEYTQKRVKSLIIGKVTKANYQDYVYKGEKLQNNLSETVIKQFYDQLKTRPWQFQLISNRITGIDVDKLDYFRRDAFYLGARNIFIDHDLLINQSLVLQDKKYKENSPLLPPQLQEAKKHRLCYPTKYSQKVYDVYYSRYKLYKTYYLNLKSNGIDYMIADILKNAQDTQQKFKFRQACEKLTGDHQGGQNSHDYIKLTDSIIQKIEDTYEELEAQNKLDIPENSKLKLAGSMIKKLKTRHIYDFVREFNAAYSYDQIGDFYKARDKLDKLKKDYQNNQQIVFDYSQIGFGIKDQDPFKQCRFYDKSKQNLSIEDVNDDFFSMLKPKGIVQISIRIYMKQKQKKPSSSEKQRTKQIENIIYQQVCDKVDKRFKKGGSGSITVRSEPEGISEVNTIKNKKQEVTNNLLKADGKVQEQEAK